MMRRLVFPKVMWTLLNPNTHKSNQYKTKHIYQAIQNNQFVGVSGHYKQMVTHVTIQGLLFSLHNRIFFNLFRWELHIFE